MVGTGQRVDISVPDQIPDYRGNLGEEGVEDSGEGRLGAKGQVPGCWQPAPTSTKEPLPTKVLTGGAP